MKRTFVAASLLLLTLSLCSCGGTSSSSTSSSEELPSIPDREEDSLPWYEVGCSDLEGLEYVYGVYSRNNSETFIVPSPVSSFSVINSYTFRVGMNDGTVPDNFNQTFDRAEITQLEFVYDPVSYEAEYVVQVYVTPFEGEIDPRYPLDYEAVADYSDDNRYYEPAREYTFSQGDYEVFTAIVYYLDTDPNDMARYMSIHWKQLGE